MKKKISLNNNSTSVFFFLTKSLLENYLLFVFTFVRSLRNVAFLHCQFTRANYNENSLAREAEWKSKEIRKQESREEEDAEDTKKKKKC